MILFQRKLEDVNTKRHCQHCLKAVATHVIFRGDRYKQPDASSARFVCEDHTPQGLKFTKVQTIK
jgi:hypothetical protein